MLRSNTNHDYWYKYTTNSIYVYMDISMDNVFLSESALTFEPIWIDFRYEVGGDVTRDESWLSDDVTEDRNVVIYA